MHCAAIGNIIERARLELAIFRFGGFSDAAREQRENKLCIFLALISVSLPPPSPPPPNFNLPPVVLQLKTFSSSSSPTNWIRISSMYTIPVAPLCPFYQGGCFACYRGKIFTEITHTSETRIFTLPDFRWVVFSCFDHIQKNGKITYFWGSLESPNPNPSPVHSFPDFPLVRVRAFDPKTRRDDEKTCAKIPSEFRSETAMSGYADDILNS